MRALSSICSRIRYAWKTHFGNVWKSIAGNAIGVICLLTIYVFLFGFQSLKKFKTKDVITIEHEENTLIAPGKTFLFYSSFIFFVSTLGSSDLIDFLLAIFIISYNPLSGLGWHYMHCEGKSGDKLIKCVEDNVYMEKDILISYYKIKSLTGKFDLQFAADSSKSIEVQPHYLDNINGMAHVMYPEPGVISKQMLSTLRLTLNNSVFYYIVIGDPKFMFNTFRLDLMPTTLIKLEKGTGQNILFLKVCNHLHI